MIERMSESGGGSSVIDDIYQVEVVDVEGNNAPEPADSPEVCNYLPTEEKKICSSFFFFFFGGVFSRRFCGVCLYVMLMSHYI